MYSLMHELVCFDLPNVSFVGIPGAFTVIYVSHGLLMRGQGWSIRQQPQCKYCMLTHQQNLSIALRPDQHP